VESQKIRPEKRRVRRKWHLAVNPATHDIVAAQMSLENVHDAEELTKSYLQYHNHDEVTQPF
jgi:hypothetical protein